MQHIRDALSDHDCNQLNDALDHPFVIAVEADDFEPQFSPEARPPIGSEVRFIGNDAMESRTRHINIAGRSYTLVTQNLTTGSSYGTRELIAGAIGTVTRHGSVDAMVRFDRSSFYNDYTANDRGEASVLIPYRQLITTDGSAPQATRPRRLGQKPDDTEEQTFIGVDDPRIQWLFEDMGKYADGQNWCGQYDTLTARLGIPARPRDFSVQIRHGDVTINGTVKARSQKEANDKFAQILREQVASSTTA